MAPPGEPGYPMPCDAAGDPVMVPGDPGSVPMMDMGGDAILQAPPADGACADMGNMMPPEGGYDHPPMEGDMMMPPPMNMDIAMMGPNDTLESMGMNPDGSGGPYEMGTMDMGGAPGDGGPAAPMPMDVMDAAMGGAPGDGGPAAPMPMDAMDAAMGSAMDGAMDQGGPAGGDAMAPAPEADSAAGGADPMPTDDVDPSAGMA
jgi:hypothetical protein